MTPAHKMLIMSATYKAGASNLSDKKQNNENYLNCTVLPLRSSEVSVSDGIQGGMLEGQRGLSAHSALYIFSPWTIRHHWLLWYREPSMTHDRVQPANRILAASDTVQVASQHTSNQ